MASVPTIWGSQQNFSKIPVLGLVAENAAAAPGTPTNGQIYYDSVLLRQRVYENGAWQNASQAGSELATNKGAASGYAPLNGSSQVPLANLPIAGSGVNSASLIVRADDSRLSDSRAPNGTATGDLTGSYPNPTIAALAVTDAKVATANKDGVAGTFSMRTLGTGAQQALAGNTRLDQIAAPTASVSLNNQKITNLLTPTNPTDAATKAYVDGISVGLDIKASVRIASVANVTGTYTATGGASTRGQFTAMPTTAIDGVTPAQGDRILLKDQTAGAQNGIWVVTTLGTGANGVWDRGQAFDADNEVSAGAFTFVEEGTVNDNSGWVLGTNNPITIGGAAGTSLTFVQFSGAGTITASNGILKTGNNLTAVGTANRISISGAGIDIAATYVGQTSITTLGTITTGVWTGTAVAVGFGGTGATTAAGARTNLAVPGRSIGLLAALVAGTETTYTHGLAQQYVQAQFFDATTNYEIRFSWRFVDANNIGVTADIAFAANAVRVVVEG